MSGYECEIITNDSCTDSNYNHTTTLLHFLFEGGEGGRVREKKGEQGRKCDKKRKDDKERKRKGQEMVHKLTSERLENKDLRRQRNRRNENR